MTSHSQPEMTVAGSSAQWDQTRGGPLLWPSSQLCCAPSSSSWTNKSLPLLLTGRNTSWRFVTTSQICSFWLTNNLLHLMRCLSLCMCASTERLWLSSGPVCGGCDAGRVLSHGSPVVRGCDGAVNQPREQPETGVWMLSTWWTAQVLGHQRAALHRPHDICPYGKLSIYDLHTEGQWSSIDQQLIVANLHC